MSIRRQDRPSGDLHVPRLKVRRLRVNPITGIILSHFSDGLLTHWKGKKSSPCLDSECPGCKEGIESRWVGYLHCQSVRGLESPQWLLQITEGGFLSLEAQLGEGHSWRGTPFRAYREHNKLERQMLIKVQLPQIAEDDGIHAALDLGEQIDRIWKLDDVRRAPSTHEKGDLL